MMKSWAIRSSSSVVTPGLACSPTSAIAWAEILPAALIFAICSGVFTLEPLYWAGAGLPTYSGRTIESGTAKRGETSPGVSVPVFESLGINPS